ncbi:MAG: hypothetical protein HRU09_19350 [Oligoflexales bacterium]|nr:hypothetical protein [Oligoflexales bacterium]
MISVGITPFANDIFAFTGLYQKEVASKLSYDFSFLDIEQLNQRSLVGMGDVNKVSFSTLGRVLNEYALLPVGSCLGEDNGPKIVSLKKHNLQDLGKLRLGIPGIQTTAYLLYRSLCPQAGKELVFPYHELLSKLKTGECDAVLLIHESRFQIEDQGCSELADLFELWFDQTKAPLPLGGLIAKRSLCNELISMLIDDISASLAYSRSHQDKAMDSILAFSAQKDRSMAQKNLDLYVTKDTYQLGQGGINGIASLLNMGYKAGLLPKPEQQWLFHT